MASIYLITNNVNSKKYVGFTTSTIERRFYEHIRNAINKNLNTPLYKAIRKYGADAFSLKLLESNDDIDYTLKVLEEKYIKLYDTYTNGYNCTLGGEGTLGLKLTPERIQFLKDINTGRKQSSEQIEKRVTKTRGMVRSVEQKQRYSKANKIRVLNGTCNLLHYKGTIWITKDSVDTRIKPEDVALYLADGWSIGRLNYKKRIWVNNGIDEKMIELDELNTEFITWKRGRLKSATR